MEELQGYLIPRKGREEGEGEEVKGSKCDEKEERENQKGVDN